MVISRKNSHSINSSFLFSGNLRKNMPYNSSCSKFNIKTSNTSGAISHNNEISEQTFVLQETISTLNCYGDHHNEDIEIQYVNEDLLNNESTEETETNTDTNTNSSNVEVSDSDENIIFSDNAENKPNNSVMFENSGTTVDEVIQMISAFCVRFNCSDEARLALFNLASTWAGEKFSTFMKSKYRISKRLDPPEDINQYVFYCTKCNCVLGKFYKKDLFTNYRHCNTCNQKYKITTNSSNYFISTNVKFQLQTLLQNRNICQILLQNVKNIEKRMRNKNINTFIDVYDGDTYKILHNNKHENTILLTFNFNTDGAPISKSSKSSMWPIQLIINELPPKLRFRYILLAGIWITKCEPKAQFMNLYMNVFIEQICDLMTKGIVINVNGKKYNFVLQPLCASVDSVARPIMQNRVQFNGYFGCSWCYQYGEYAYGSMKYPFMDDDPLLRDHESYIKDIKYAEEMGRPHRGVKNFAEITKLKDFDCVWGFSYDYMHGLLLGVVNTLWAKFWANIGTEEYNLSRTDKRNIEERLLRIKMPSEIHRQARSFNSGKWKASEWRSWILYLSIPSLGYIKLKIFKFIWAFSTLYT